LYAEPGGFREIKEQPMILAANIVIGLVVVLHVYFLVLEMFLWDKPLGRKVFKLTPEFATASKVLAANQGLYNGFLVAGLVWGLWLGVAGRDIKVFFLGCVIVAGVYGAYSVSRRVLLIQAVPAAVALLLLLIA
jgi:putative membrane protein